jgi:hypothetical protein
MAATLGDHMVKSCLPLGERWRQKSLTRDNSLREQFALARQILTLCFCGSSDCEIRRLKAADAFGQVPAQRLAPGRAA